MRKILTVSGEVKMEFIRVKTYAQLSERAAQIILAQIEKKPESVLGLATGSTPVGTYNELIKAYESGKADFSNVKTVNLDEYCGLSGDNGQSYRYFMNKHLFDKVNINKANTNIPDGTAADLEKECERYDSVIEALGGIDLQILGIGVNGHIGFNEPSDEFSHKTHVVELDEKTRISNSRFFEKMSDVPDKAVTVGTETIMSAEKILLLANGEAKKDIIEKAVHGEITPRVPASILQKHKNLTVIFSEE